LDGLGGVLGLPRFDGACSGSGSFSSPVLTPLRLIEEAVDFSLVSEIAFGFASVALDG